MDTISQDEFGMLLLLHAYDQCMVDMTASSRLRFGQRGLVEQELGENMTKALVLLSEQSCTTELH